MKKLSREEMRKVMGGSNDAVPGEATYKCCIGNECTSCSPHPQCGPDAKQYTCNPN